MEMRLTSATVLDSEVSIPDPHRTAAFDQLSLTYLTLSRRNRRYSLVHFFSVNAE
jgi:hypothetical protein